LACLLFEALFALFHEKSFLVQDGATDVNAIALYKDSILHTSSKDILEKDIATGILLRTFRAHSSLIDTFVVSEDNRMITSGYDNMIIVWDLVTGSILKRISLGASETRIQRIVLKNDQLFAGGLDGFARQINIRTGRVAKSIGKSRFRSLIF
jgi:WD40 repeat protein